MSELHEAVEKCSTFMETLSEAPEQLFDRNETLSSQIKSILKPLYDFTKNQEIKLSKSNSLPELITQNFDDEQIWQQLELQNDWILENAVSKVSSLLLGKNKLSFGNSHNTVDSNNQKCDEIVSDEIEDFEEPESGNDLDELESGNDLDELESGNDLDELESGNEEIGSELDEIEDELNSEDEKDESEPNPHKKNGKKSVVDDDFFKLHEMEEFLNAEEKKINQDSGNEKDLAESDEDSEESVDLFEEKSEDIEDEKVRLAKYKEFFVSKTEEKKPKRNKFLEEFSDEDDEDESAVQQSTLELRQSRLKNKIEEIETKAVSEKPWQLQGEIKADSRPQNSLLEEYVEFDRTSRPAPIVTGQTTLQLEDIIRQRIKDKVFDSVERKVKLMETPFEYKKQLVLDQEKSKASLAQIYEKEYLDQQAALDPDNSEKPEEEPALHKEINSMMKTLFNQLDALSNFHYTPKPAIPELKIISNLPAINMEEVAPVAASDAALLAPEEVKNKPKADVLGKSERTTTDKNRERRKKKLKQRYHVKEKQKREDLLNKSKPGMKNKYSKEKAQTLLKNVTKQTNVEKMDQKSGRIKSSTSFFTKLQDEVQSHVKSKGAPRDKKSKNIHNAKKMKL